MAAEGLPVDLELKKAFQGLQNKLIATKQQVKVNDAQIEGLKRQNQHSAIVKSEISSLPNTTRAYQGVGRMFLLTPKDQVLKALDSKSKDNADKIKNIESQKLYLEKSMKDAENNLRELVMSKQKR
ncbi:prefoldin subunit 1-like [Watersipora subatra]|uniref:prefoldin subunit 1-like n=1 Tax=Watersipora subatra TaxID=2589382 RepID=UPI00355BDF0E